MMGPSSEALRDAVVFYISSENRCARCYVPRINHDHRIHPQKKTRAKEGRTTTSFARTNFWKCHFLFFSGVFGGGDAQTRDARNTDRS